MTGSRGGFFFAAVLALATAAIAEERLTLEDLRLLLRTGSDQSEIISMVKGADYVEVRREDLPKLRSWGAGDALIRAIAALLDDTSAPVYESVLRQLRDERPEAEIIAWIVAQGRPSALSPREKLELGRAGASADVILALEGRYVLPGFVRYVPDHRLFAIQYPRGWKAYQWYTSEGLKVLFSPETDVEGANLFRTGVQIQCGTLWPSERRQGVFAHHLKTERSFIRLNRVYEIEPVPGPAGRAQKTQVAGHEAVTRVFDAKYMETPCREIYLRTAADDITYLIEAVAPRDEFAELEPLFRKVLSTFRPVPSFVPPRRRKKPLDTTVLLDRYRAAVVHIQAHFKGATGFGSGFCVREDGWVLTNHHVICGKKDHSDCADDPEKMKLADRFTVVWDSAVEPKPPGQKHRKAPAKLIGTIYKTRPGVDLALLKIPASKTPYRAFPLSPCGRERATGLAKQGDPVVVLGFPLPTRFGIDRLTPTQGVLSRLDYVDMKLGGRGRQRTLDRITHDAESNKGNSGGPVVDLYTGAVIGLQTWGSIAVSGETAMAGEKLGYQQASAIDWALHYFPQLRFYPLYRDLPPPAKVDLAGMLVSAGHLEAARAELAAVRKVAGRLNADQRAELAYQESRWANKRGDREARRKLLNEALEHNPRHTNALVERAHTDPSPKKGLLFVEHAIRVLPDSYNLRAHRADLLLRLRRHDDALRDVRRARDDLGGDHDPWVHYLEGRILYARNELDAGLQAFRRAAAIDPAYVTARVAVAEYYTRKKDRAKAEKEYRRVVKDLPDLPRAHLELGYFLARDAKRRPEALSHLIRATNLLLDEDERPGPVLLGDLSALALLVDGKDDVAMQGARLLYRHWPGWRPESHESLGRAWKKKERPALAYAHFAAFERAEGKASRHQGGLAPLPLALKDAEAMILANYELDLFAATLGDSGLGFPWSGKLAGELQQKNKWPRPFVVALANRYIEDQKRGSAALAQGIRIGFEGPIQLGKDRPWSWVVLTNNGKVPVAYLRARIRYFRERDSKGLLFTDEFSLDTDGPILPGKKRKLKILWHPWTTLKGKGVTRSFGSLRLEILSARNADYLTWLRVSGKYKGSAYHYTIENKSLFKVRSPRLRCLFTDTGNRPLTGAPGTTRASREVVSFTTPKGLVLAPGQKSQEFKVSAWGDWKYLRSLGVPRHVRTVNVRVSVANAEIVR